MANFSFSNHAASTAPSRLHNKFLADTAALRPALHRYCSRMTGSVLDGEDLVQETLTHALLHLDSLHREGALRAWLFRIAHNRCIDFLRARSRREVTVDRALEAVVTERDRAEERQEVALALEVVVSALPARERAAVLLKDVLGYSATEAAAITGSTVGAVKAALHRGRAKMRQLPRVPPVRAAHETELINRYIALFNAQDWDAVRSLIRDDATLEVVGMSRSRMGDGYFRNYARFAWTWRIAWGDVDGERLILHLERVEDRWKPRAAVRLTATETLITVVRDYIHVDHLFAFAHSIRHAQT